MPNISKTRKPSGSSKSAGMNRPNLSTMKTRTTNLLLIWTLLVIGAAVAEAADINLNFPSLTDRERYGVKFVVERENAAKVAKGDTNFLWTVSTYRQTNVVQVISNLASNHYYAVLENYATQADAAFAARLAVVQKRIYTEAQLALIESITSTNAPPP